MTKKTMYKEASLIVYARPRIYALQCAKLGKANHAGE